MEIIQIKNNTLEEIAAALSAAESILFFPHHSMDGDTLGSSVALCRALRTKGKLSFVIIEDEIPDMISFLDCDCCTDSLKIVDKPDLCVCVDCGELSRLNRRRELFESGRTKMCIDHHISTTPFLEWNYIDPAAAATAEIAYEIITILGLEIDKDISEAIYTGIVTDTGLFQYSNTTKKTHLITAGLYDCGLNSSETAIKIYQSVSREKMILEANIISTIELFAEGKVAIAYMTQEMLNNSGAKPDDTDGVVERLRGIKGVEIAALVRERRDGRIKVSLRSKQYANVAAFSEPRGGGGHIRAAGYTADSTVDEVKTSLAVELEGLLKRSSVSDAGYKAADEC
ncbi:MAG: bifunctional oligoribonuclease/PAP phosphatase NrnA [Clostridiales Family XIII bacterium]|jgi:phosphoesterase RecJ-like protein|nr:bifunctional oligoribonuclease/PAP phosphatase NrnA [Clostridiales Family XIII bacterium]